MVLIHSRFADETANEITCWLNSYGTSFKRINFIQDFFNFIFANEKGIEISGNNEERIKSFFSSFYFNGGAVRIESPIPKDDKFGRGINKFLVEESKLLYTHIFHVFPKQGFGNFPIDINKLTALQTARDCGLKVPPTAIVHSKKQLEYYFSKWERIITKSIGNGAEIEAGTYSISGQRTEEIKRADLERMANDFSPSLIQKLILKSFEVRVFWFKDEVYSVSIFSQRDEAAMIDFRNGDKLRTVPYKLNTELQNSLNTLMHRLNLNYGSIDLIVTPSDETYFLEVNPFGQFGFLSKAGNFHIEKRIADYLNKIENLHARAANQTYS
ncbi:MAG: hypothetical protein LBV59_11770 [Sphingobacterium sp.]|jgi:hypothetical protein|uniref:hypothetical protein n=1 Tax=Sphingobacterium sp. TaxID=341027 RepID=UPI002849042D|nr:hypothetical protein [Sphingobacterium sp.]MDR3008606.1 hypothetical protein [Sphingobacterium sp.]